MASSIPTKFLFRYRYLGTFTLIMFILSFISTNTLIRISPIHMYETPIIDVFMITGVIFLLFETINFRDSRSVDERYAYDSVGVYRDGYLVADWDQVRSVTVQSGKMVKRIGAGSYSSSNAFLTDRPLSNEMRRRRVDEITKTESVARIFIQGKSPGVSNHPIVIETTPIGFVLSGIYRRMQNYAGNRSLTVDFNKEELPVEDDGGKEAAD